MILIDFSTISLTTDKIIILNNIRYYKQKFNQPILIATDSPPYWRKNIFPFYKANRKASREKSSLDFPKIFETRKEIIQDLKTYFPYKIIEVPNTEADDIIATLAKPTDIIISSDSDLTQLNIKQFSPRTNSFIKSDPDFLFKKILKGDPKDGVPNILSKPSQLVEKIKQKSITKSFIESFNISEHQENYNRNKSLLDLSEIPQYIKDQIINEFNKPTSGNKSTILKYFIKNKYKTLIECIEEF